MINSYVPIRANAPAPPHNIWEILKDYKFRPHLKCTIKWKINKGIRNIKSGPYETLQSIGKIDLGIKL